MTSATLSPDNIRRQLAALPGIEHYYVGYSGGADSHVLLHLLSRLPELEGRLTAVYVDHGLQPEAGQWGDHCRLIAAQLKLPFRRFTINAQPQPGQSPEEAARIGRYRALAGLLSANDALVLAHHRDDQMETFLLQCLRGAGVKGLSAMPDNAPLGQGRLLRPLLTISHQTILDYARQNRLRWIEDPSNAEDRFDRNFLRNQVVPLLRLRWPGLDQTISRSAQHCAEAEALLNRNLKSHFQNCHAAADNSLNLTALGAQPPAVIGGVIRYWLADMKHKMPNRKPLQHLAQAILDQKARQGFWLRTPDYQLASYQNRLYCLPGQLSQPPSAPITWSDKTRPPALTTGWLTATAADRGLALDAWLEQQVEIRFRQGGESLALPGRGGHRCLKKIFQDFAVPPWRRERTPLIYLDGQLAAVAGIGIAREFYRTGEQNAVTFTWQPLA